MTAPERHALAILRPWYAPTGRTLAIHRYLDAGFVDRFRADVAQAPEGKDQAAGLSAWEAEDRMAAGPLKLRRPMHGAFHVVAWEAACEIPGAPDALPAVSPTKIAEAGFVVRAGRPEAPYGFRIAAGQPAGWARVEPGADPDDTRQLRALGLISARTPDPPSYSGEEIFPLHALPVARRDRARTLLYGYLPIGGAEYVAPAQADADGELVDDLPWPFGLFGLTATPVSGAGPQIVAGTVNPALAALFRVTLGRFGLATAAGWDDPANGPLAAALDGLAFAGTTLSLGALLRDEATARAVLADSLAAFPNGTVTLGSLDLTLNDAQAAQLRSAMRARQAAAVTAASGRAPRPKLRPGPDGRYFVVPFVRSVRPDGCPRLTWGAPSEAFAIAAAFDPDAARATVIEMPSLADAMRTPRGGVGMDMPPDLADLAMGLGSQDAVQAMVKGTKPSGLGIRYVCSISLPAITICATLLISITIGLLNLALQWSAWIKICLPLPAKKPSSP